METIAEKLIGKYGLLMTYEHLAEVLHRSPEGLRISLGQDGDVGRMLSPSRIKIGRRVYFRTVMVADIIDKL